MAITYHYDLIQGDTLWLAARCGILTASEMKLIITPTLKIANNDKTRSHLYELLAQRITRFVEPSYIGDDMLRGYEDEIDAKQAYAANYLPVEDCGFVTNDNFGFTIGFSPDGLVEKEGFIEIKSRRQKYQVETIIECVGIGSMPADYMIQVQTGFLVTERRWCDFISYSAGLPMATVRIYPDPVIGDAILKAATAFEMDLAQKRAKFFEIMDSGARLLQTERRVEQGMF
jgi:hypothetical protein